MFFVFRGTFKFSAETQARSRHRIGYTPIACITNMMTVRTITTMIVAQVRMFQTRLLA